MSHKYIVHRIDDTQKAIVAVLEATGWQVFTRLPCDLLLYRGGVWKTLECKTAKNKSNDPKLDKRQKKQAEFLAATNTPIAVTPQQALEAVKVGPNG